MSKTISVIIPVLNEEKNLPFIIEEISAVFQKLAYKHEILFVDDGSTDHSVEAIKMAASADNRISYIAFSRNFGKEMATTAGLNNCRGDCAIIIDADLQHPVSMITSFLAEWEKGSEVVVGVRKASKSDTWFKSFGSRFFYKIMDKISETNMIPNSTDFQLIDRKVIDAFNLCTEKTRITRGLIAWLGFKRTYIEFEAKERLYGQAGYSHIKLIRLALSSFVAMSLFPLRVAGYLGIFITLFAGLLGVFIFADKFMLGNHFNFTWLATLTVTNIFLIGIVLSCLGLIALYIGRISGEVSNRPMYVIRERKN